jgi:hypothetical protein
MVNWRSRKNEGKKRKARGRVRKGFGGCLEARQAQAMVLELLPSYNLLTSASLLAALYKHLAAPQSFLPQFSKHTQAHLLSLFVFLPPQKPANT